MERPRSFRYRKYQVMVERPHGRGYIGSVYRSPTIPEGRAPALTSLSKGCPVAPDYNTTAFFQRRARFDNLRRSEPVGARTPTNGTGVRGGFEAKPSLIQDHQKKILLRNGIRTEGEFTLSMTTEASVSEGIRQKERDRNLGRLTPLAEGGTHASKEGGVCTEARVSTFYAVRASEPTINTVDGRSTIAISESTPIPPATVECVDVRLNARTLNRLGTLSGPSVCGNSPSSHPRHGYDPQPICVCTGVEFNEPTSSKRPRLAGPRGCGQWSDYCVDGKPSATLKVKNCRLKQDSVCTPTPKTSGVVPTSVIRVQFNNGTGYCEVVPKQECSLPRTEPGEGIAKDIRVQRKSASELLGKVRIHDYQALGYSVERHKGTPCALRKGAYPYEGMRGGMCMNRCVEFTHASALQDGELLSFGERATHASALQDGELTMSCFRADHHRRCWCELSMSCFRARQSMSCIHASIAGGRTTTTYAGDRVDAKGTGRSQGGVTPPQVSAQRSRSARAAAREDGRITSFSKEVHTGCIGQPEQVQDNWVLHRGVGSISGMRPDLGRFSEKDCVVDGDQRSPSSSMMISSFTSPSFGNMNVNSDFVERGAFGGSSQPEEKALARSPKDKSSPSFRQSCNSSFGLWSPTHLLYRRTSGDEGGVSIARRLCSSRAFQMTSATPSLRGCNGLRPSYGVTYVCGNVAPKYMPALLTMELTDAQQQETVPTYYSTDERPGRTTSNCTFTRWPTVVPKQPKIRTINYGFITVIRSGHIFKRSREHFQGTKYQVNFQLVLPRISAMRVHAYRSKPSNLNQSILESRRYCYTPSFGDVRPCCAGDSFNSPRVSSGTSNWVCVPCSTMRGFMESLIAHNQPMALAARVMLPCGGSEGTQILGSTAAMIKACVAHGYDLRAKIKPNLAGYSVSTTQGRAHPSEERWGFSGVTHNFWTKLRQQDPVFVNGKNQLLFAKGQIVASATGQPKVRIIQRICILSMCNHLVRREGLSRSRCLMQQWSAGLHVKYFYSFIL